MELREIEGGAAKPRGGNLSPVPWGCRGIVGEAPKARLHQIKIAFRIPESYFYLVEIVGFEPATF